MPRIRREKERQARAGPRGAGVMHRRARDHAERVRAGWVVAGERVHLGGDVGREPFATRGGPGKDIGDEIDLWL